MNGDADDRNAGDKTRDVGPRAPQEVPGDDIERTGHTAGPGANRDESAGGRCGREKARGRPGSDIIETHEWRN